MLQSVKVPILLVGVNDDATVMRSRTESLHWAVPQSRLIFIRGNHSFWNGGDIVKSPEWLYLLGQSKL